MVKVTPRFRKFKIFSSKCPVCVFSRRFMKWIATKIVTLFSSPNEPAKTVPKSSTEFGGVKLDHLAQGTELKKVVPFFSVTYITGPDYRAPFRFFAIQRLFWKVFNVCKVSPLIVFNIFQQMLKKSIRVRHFRPTFEIFRYCRREYLTTRITSYCYFWASDIAPTWAVPDLFSFASTIDPKIVDK